MEIEGGYDISRFQGEVPTDICCTICQKVAKSPLECQTCGVLYCSTCIQEFNLRAKTCISKCPTIPNQFQKLKGALLRFYNNLDVRCVYPSCNRMMKLTDLEKHESICSRPQCSNFDLCKQFVSIESTLKQQKVCSGICLLTYTLWSSKDLKSSRDQIRFFLDSFKQEQQNVIQPSLSSPDALTFYWDAARGGQGITVTDNKTRVFLKESAYMFRSIISDTPIMSGIHYWEIVADPRTENELKIGVCTSQQINFNSAFCDCPNGWAYYGLAQLRHNSNASGQSYGKRFKKEGVLGVCLNMKTGTLSFALNGENMGVAFQSPALTKGPVFAAVALLHCAGCVLTTGKPVPPYMLN